MKAVLISIQPKWVEKIASGKKTIEVRKTRPKIDTPFKCFIYCTIGNGMKGDYLVPSNIQCGKVIGEFVCDDIDTVRVFNDILYCVKNSQANKLAQMCLTIEEVKAYLGNNNGYNWHISNLVVYDKPKELSEFWYHCKYEFDDDFKNCAGCDYYYCSNNPSSGREEYCGCDGLKRLKRAPQSWQYVEVAE